VVDLGLPLVETYVPWSIHERGVGRFDFGDGPVVDGFERDLGGFLDACAARNLKVILRPGPHINAELTHFGYPERIIVDPKCQARGSQGNPVVLPVPPRAFPVPSYASEAFHHEAAVWLKAFADFVAPRCWPAGPVVAVQVDNELSLFFRTGAYDQDYHPDAVVLYQAFLSRRGTDPAQEPPRRFDAADAGDLVRHLDWVAFKEWLVVWALDRMARVLRMCGLDRVVLFHNFPAQRWGAPCSLPGAEQVLDLAGLDIYLGRRDYQAVKAHALSLVGSSRLPFVPELGCGGWPWWFAFDRADQRAVMLNVLMHGVRGFNLYMVVERDRWYGSPVATDGQRRRDHFAEIGQLVAAIKGSTEEPGLMELERPVSVGLMRVRDYERLALCTALTDPLPPAALDLLGVTLADVSPDEPPEGLSCPVARDYALALAEASAALDGLQVPYHYLDSDVSADRLSHYELLLVPTFEFMDEALMDRLRTYVSQGGRLLTWPETPRLDGRLQPLSEAMVFPGVGTGPLATVLPEVLAERDLLPAATVDPADSVDLTVWSDAQREAQIVFVANRGARPCRATIRGLPCSLRDALGGEPVDINHISLDAFQVRMLRRSPDGGRFHG